MVISDLHNDVEFTKAVVSLFNEEKFDKLYILGDILADSIRLLNPLFDKILAVKGNCDGYEEEDLARFAMPYLTFDYQFGKLIVLTHGHYFNSYNYDRPFDIMLMGHTHQSFIYQNQNGQIIANPGSIARPRDGFYSYMVMDEEGMRVIDFNSKAVIHSLHF